MWLDGADRNTITLSGSNVTTWADKSGRGCNATKAAAGTITLSNNRIVFNGTSYLTLPSGTLPTGNSDYSFLTVGSTDRSSYQNIFFTGNYVSGQSIDAIYYPNGALESGWYTANIVSSAGTISANQTTLVENVYSSPTLTAYVNGTSVASSSSLGTRNNPAGVTVLGGNLEGNQALIGTMCEFLVYSNGLTTTQRQQVEGYLARKWGLMGNLPATHPFKSIPPTLRPFAPVDVPGCQLWLDAADSSTMTFNGTATFNQYVTTSSQTVSYTGTLTSLTQFTGGTSFMNGAFINSGNGLSGSLVPSATSGDWYSFCMEGGVCKVVKLRFTLSAGVLSVQGLSAGYNTTNLLTTSTSASTNDTYYATYTSVSIATSSSANGYGVASFTMNFSSTTGSNVTQWNDKSGNSRNAVNQTTGAVLTSNVQNGLPVLRMNGSQNYSVSYNSFPNTAYTIFALQYLSSASGYRRLLHAPTGGDTGIFLGVNEQNIATFTGNATNGWNDVTANSPNITNLNTWKIVTMWVSSSTLTPYVDGTAQSNKTGTTGSFSGLTIGCSPNLNIQQWVGDVAEILIYSSALTTSQRQQLEGYLAKKWGLQPNLPSGHPYYYAPPFAFTPTQISGCQLWLDAADASSITLSGSNVATWADKSGNGRDFTQATTSNRPVYGTFLSQPGVSFTGSNSTNLSNSYIQTGSGGRNLFIVFYDVNTTANAFGNPVLFYMATSNSNALGDWRAAFDASNNYLGLDSYAAAYLYRTSPNVTSMRTSRAIGMWGIASGAAFNTAYVYGNGTQFTTLVNSFANTSSLNVQNSGVTTIGGGPQTGFVTSVISEILYYTTDITTNQRQQIEGYLAHKWGLRNSLPAPHPYQYSLPALTVGFTPVTLSNCSLWLDAADRTTITLSGSNVTQWNDKSGNGNNVTQGTGSLQPTYSSTSNAIVFNATGYLSIPNALSLITPTYTVFVVDKRATSNVSFFIGEHTVAIANTALILGYNDTSTSHHTTAYVADLQVTIPAYQGASEPRRMHRFGYTGTTRNTFINGGQYSASQSFSNTLPVWSNANVGAGFWSPGQAGQTWWYVGNIHEVLFFNRVLTTSESQQVEGYLAWKWGLLSNLPTNHTYRLVKP